MDINSIKEDDFTLPIDKKVANMLKEGFKAPDIIRITD
jgi:hypothetical protein